MISLPSNLGTSRPIRRMAGTGCSSFTSEAVALDAVLLREEDLADPRLAGLVEVVQEIEEGEKIRQLLFLEGGAGHSKLPHLFIHGGGVVPHGRGDLEEGAFDSRASQVGPDPSPRAA